jgi:hypothetical protein
MSGGVFQELVQMFLAGILSIAEPLFLGDRVGNGISFGLRRSTPFDRGNTAAITR